MTGLAYTVGIIHYRDPAAVGRLLTSISTWLQPPSRILVADNSSDLASSVLTAAPAGVPAEIIDMGSNEGYAGAANRLLAHLSVAEGAFLLLTQDADLGPNSAGLMAETLRTNPSAAVVAPLLLFAEDRMRVFSAGGVITRRGRTLHPEQGEMWCPGQWDALPSREVDWADGACLMLRVTAVRDVGLFDPNYFLYVEEVDLQFRLRLRGHKVLLNPAAVAYQQPGPYSLYYKYRNLPRFTRAHRTNLRPWPWAVALPKDSVRMLRQRRFSEPLWALRGLLDHFRGASGPRPKSLFASLVRRSDASEKSVLGNETTSVDLIVETEPALAPPGIRRRYEHVLSWLESQEIRPNTHVLLPGNASGESRGRRFLRVVGQRRSLAKELPEDGTVLVLGLGAAHMLLIAGFLARSRQGVWYDACDSWSMQFVSRLRTRRLSTIAPAAIGSVLQLLTRRNLSVSYITERDRRSDRFCNGGRRTAVIDPTAPAELLGLPPLSGERPTRVVVTADFTAFHNAAGVAALVEAWGAITRLPSVELELYGKGVGEVPAYPGIRAVGWSDSIADVYAGPTLVTISNVAGSGIPNKLIDAVAAQRPMVLHESMKVFLRPHPWLFFYSSRDDLVVRLSEALDREYTFDPKEPIRLMEVSDV